MCVLPPAEGSAEGTLQCSVDVAAEGAEGVSIGSGPQANYELAAGESMRIVYAHGSEQAILAIVESQAGLSALYASYLLTSASPALAAAAFSPALLGAGAGALALAGGGGGASPDPAGPSTEEIALVALNKVKDYAEDVNKPAPTVDDYKNIGVTGVSAENLAAINSAIDAQGGTDKTPGNSDDSTSVDSAEKLQKIISAYNAIFEVADGTANNADDPTQETYEAIGITGMDDPNKLSLLGEVLDGKTKAEVDTASKLQTLASAVQNVMLAAAGTKGIPSKEELEALGIKNVTAENLAAIQKAIQATENNGSEVASLENLQNQVNIGIGNAKAALEKIADYAHDSTDNPAPSLEDYENAGVTGVSAENLAAVNALVDAQNRVGADTTKKVQDLVDANADQLAAMQIIANYADSANNEVPTLSTYENAGVDGVTVKNVGMVNAIVEGVEREDADSAEEVEALLLSNAIKLRAMEKIANYADDSDTNVTPTLADYDVIGVDGVSAANLAAVNELVDAEEREGADTPAEVQALIEGASARLNALDKIAAYADDSSKNDAPSLEDYQNAGIKNVTSGNLATVNAAIDAATKTQADTQLEVQDIVEKALADPSILPTTPSELEKIANYAESATNPVPTLVDYQTLGIEGVSANNLAAVNEIIDGVSKEEANTKGEVQALVTAAKNKLDALEKIANYAESNGNPKPTLADYEAAEIDGVNAGNVDAVNALVDAEEREGADTEAEVEGLIAAHAVKLAAIEIIANYADSDTNEKPALSTYEKAGINGVDANNLAFVNVIVEGVERTDADTAEEVEALLLENAVKLKAMETIANYADDSDANVTPTLADYVAIAINGVSTANLAAVNELVDAEVRKGADTPEEVQALITGALSRLNALDKIAAYADDSSNNEAPTLEDYQNAGIEKVTSSNLATVNAAIDAATKTQADTQLEVQGIVDNALATTPVLPTTPSALEKIANYAESSTNPKPALSDYEEIGIDGVSAKNLAAVNEIIDGVGKEQANTAEEIQALVTAAKIKLDAIEKIANYADDHTNAIPTLADYLAADIDGVNSSNVDAVNALVDAQEREGADTEAEVEALILSNAVKLAALEVIANYAHSDSNEQPTLSTYESAGIDGVNANNLAFVNIIVEAVERKDADTEAEVEALLLSNAIKLRAMENIANYADDSDANVTPTLADYDAIGVDGVSAANLAAVNELVDAEEREGADTPAEVQALITGAINRLNALDIIAAYAHNSIENPPPSLQNYLDAGIENVGAGNLHTVNNAIDAASKEQADTQQEVQDIVDKVLADPTTLPTTPTALEKIANYAESATNPEPTLLDYQTVGIDGVSANNLAAVNEIIDGVSKEEADTKGEIQALVTAAKNKLDALEKIANYAENKGNPKPILADYEAAEIDGVNAGNVDAVNALVDAEEREGADTEAEVEALVASNAINLAAIEKIANYADDNGNPTPTLQDYTDAGVDGVTAGNLAASNSIIDGAEKEGADTKAEVQALLDGAVVKIAALVKIANYADNSVVHPAPTYADYVDAGIERVSAEKLAAINELIDAASRSEANSQAEVQAIIDGAAAKLAALEIIANYAHSAGNEVPSLSIYETANIDGVNASNVAFANILVEAVEREDADTEAEVEALLLNNAAKLKAMEKIANYAHDSDANVTPTLADYDAIGVNGVSAANLAAVNELVDAVTREGADTPAEVQALITDAVNRLSALDIIAAYAHNSSENPPPSLQNYLNAGIKKVDAGNLDTVNNAIDAATKTQADTQLEVQGIVDNALATTPVLPTIPTALEKIANYAESSTNPEPSLDDYEEVGINGVSANNLAAVNEIIDGVSKKEADTAEEIQALVNAAQAKLTAIEKIANYAASSSNAKPTLADYLAAQVDGVNAANLETVNALVEAEEREGADTEAEVEALILANAVKLNAIEKIANYAHDSGNPTPTLIDYQNAGINGVSEANLNALNTKVEAEEREGADTVAEVQALVGNANAAVTAALAKIAAYAKNVNNPVPEASDYSNAGVNGVDIDKVGALNSAVDAQTGSDDITGNDNDSDAVETVAQIQNIVNAYDVIFATADGTADNAEDPSAGVYTTLGVTDIDMVVELKLLGEVLDAKSNVDVNTVPKIQGLADAVQAVMNAAEGTTGIPSKEQMEALGIDGVTDDNLELVQAAIAATAVDGSEVDEVTEIQNLVTGAVNKFDAAKSVIMQYAADGTTAPEVSHYEDYGVKKVVGAAMVAAINSAVHAQAGVDGATGTADDSAAVDSPSKVQAMVTAYEVIFAAADDGVSVAGNPAAEIYTTLGVTDVDTVVELNLLGEVLDGKKNEDVATVPLIQGLADAVQGVMNGAKGDADVPTKEQLELLGIGGVTDDNLAAVQVAIGETLSDGTGVDEISELEGLVVTAINGFTAAQKVIMDYADNADNTKPIAADYKAYGVKGVVTADDVIAINSAVNAQTGSDDNAGDDNDSVGVNTRALVQDIVDAYEVIFATADGTADNAEDPSAGVYTTLGVTDVDTDVELNLLGEVLDAKNNADVATVPLIQGLADAVQGVMNGAKGDANVPTKEQLELLGIGGVTDDNLAAVQVAIGETLSDGTGVDEISELEGLVVTAIDGFTAAQKVIMDYADNADNTKPIAADYKAYGVKGVVTADDVIAINSAVNAQTGSDDNAGDDNDSVGVNTRALVQDIVDAYEVIFATADGTADNAEDPSAGVYTTLGVTDVDTDVELNLLGEVLDAKNNADVATVPLIQGLADAVQAVMDAANGATDKPSLDQLKALGINDVTPDNLERVQAAIAATAVDGNEVDEVQEIQDLVNTMVGKFDNAKNVIMDYAADGITAPEASHYEDYGVKQVVGAAMVAAINSAVHAQAGADGATGTSDDSGAVDSPSKVQAMVAAYEVIFATADGTADNAEDPSQATYSTLGVTGVDSTVETTLLGEVLDAKSNADVATVPLIQGLADAVQAVMDAASGATDKPSLDQLKALGINDVTPDNLERVQAAIAATAVDGNEVDEVQEIQDLVNTTVGKFDNAKNVIMDYAADGITAPEASHYEDYGVKQVVGAAMVAAINSAVHAQAGADGATGTSDDSGAVDSPSKVQAMVAAYEVIFATADGTADNAEDPSQATYSTLGVTGVDSTVETTLLGEVLDAKSNADVATVPLIQGLADAVQAVMDAANGATDKPSLDQLKALGINDVTPDNLERVQAAIAATAVDGSEVDEVQEIQNLVDTTVGKFDNAKNVIMQYAADGTTPPEASHYEDYGVKQVVGAAMVAAINSAVHAQAGADGATGTSDDSGAVDSPSKVQAMVAAYEVIFATADGAADNAEDPSQATYSTLGVTGVDSIVETTLLGEVLGC